MGRRAEEIVDELEKALRGGAERSLPRGIVELPRGEEEGDALERRLGALVRSMTVLRRFNHDDEFRFKDIDALYGEALRVGSPQSVLETLNYLRLYDAFAARMRALEVEGAKWFDTRLPREAAASLIEAVEGVDGFSPQLTGSRLMLGKLHALADRSRAHEQFGRALEVGGPGLGVLAHDRPVITYFDEATLERGRQAIAERRSSLPPLREHGQASLGDSRFLVLMSCERRFLRIYLPYWLSVAEYLKPLGFAYRLLITDSDGSAPELVERAEELRRALAGFRGCDEASFCDHVSFSSTPVPAWCADPRSYSACARYLYARELCERAEIQVIVHDIDMFVSHDPSVWFGAMPADKVLLGSYSPNLSIDPWRKFSAGIFGLPPDESAFRLMRRMEDYLLLGLGEKAAWYLDQNALSYLHDTVTDGDSDLGELLFSIDGQREGMVSAFGGVRPVHMLPVHGLFEKSQG